MRAVSGLFYKQLRDGFSLLYGLDPDEICTFDELNQSGKGLDLDLAVWLEPFFDEMSQELSLVENGE